MVFIVHPHWLAANKIKVEHVEDNYWNKLRKKVHLVGSYYANISWCTVHIMSNFGHMYMCMSVVTVAYLKQICTFLLYGYIFMFYPTDLNLVTVYVGLFSLVECSKQDKFWAKFDRWHQWVSWIGSEILSLYGMVQELLVLSAARYSVGASKHKT